MQTQTQTQTQTPVQEQRVDLGLQRWREALGHAWLADLPYKAETNRFGQLVLSPLTSFA